MSRAVKASRGLAGRWVGADGEYVATIRGSSIAWPDGSKLEFQVVEGPGWQL